MGIVTALQFLPMLLLGSWGGLIVDRVDKRRLLYVTQAASGVLALALGLLTAVGTITMWEVYLIATLFGMVNLFDNPARQTFVSEMVGRDLMPNAISLNSVVMNSARVIGPAIGGVLIFAVGLAACFLFNAASYVAVIVALFMMRPGELHRRPVVVRAKGQVREGLRYVWSTPGLRDPLLTMAVVGIFAFNFTTTLPLLATHTFGGGAGTYSALMAAMGLGAVIGGLMVAHRSRPSTAMLSLIGLAFGVMLLAVAAAPTEAVALVALVFMGLCSISFISTANATIQLQADPAMRGSRDGPLFHRLPRQHAHRCAARRLDRRYQQPAGGRTGRRRGHPSRLCPAGPPLLPGWRPDGPVDPGDGGRGARRRAGRGGRLLAAADRGHQHRRQRGRRTDPGTPGDGQLRPHEVAGSGRGSLGSPSTRSPTMLRWISAVPPQIVSDREKKNDAWRSSTG